MGPQRNVSVFDILAQHPYKPILTAGNAMENTTRHNQIVQALEIVHSITDEENLMYS